MTNWMCGLEEIFQESGSVIQGGNVENLLYCSSRKNNLAA